MYIKICIRKICQKRRFMHKKITALLPMKGNSERVPNKNIRNFNGNPLLSYALNALDSSKYIDKIIINTDSDNIAEIGKRLSNKVLIHNRPKEIMGDFVSMNEIINHDVLKSGGEHFIQTHSTNPLLKTDSIDQAIECYFQLIQKEYDSVFSVTKLQTRLYNEKGEPVNHNPNELLRTQDLPPLFEENSNFFIFSKDSFLKSGKKRIGEKPYLFPMNKIEAIDIDEEEDFLIAEAIDKLNILK